jgi:hypothetical protein
MTSNPSLDDATAAIPGVPHRWTALTIALMVIGFIVFWPLGLAVIAYVLWGERIMAFCRGKDTNGAVDGFRKAAEDVAASFRRSAPFAGSCRTGGFGGSPKTGNVAFDAWREAEAARIEAERKKLDETTAAFEAHLRAERGAFDESRQREEFERFMSGRGHA